MDEWVGRCRGQHQSLVTSIVEKQKRNQVSETKGTRQTRQGMALVHCLAQMLLLEQTLEY